MTDNYATEEDTAEFKNWHKLPDGEHILYTPPPAQRKPLSNGEIYTAYITATNQTLRPQDERLAFAFARAIEAELKEKNT